MPRVFEPDKTLLLVYYTLLQEYKTCPRLRPKFKTYIKQKEKGVVSI